MVLITTSTLLGVEVQMNLLKNESTGSNTKVPAVGSSIKVIETTDDTDFICKNYVLKTKGVGYEIKEIITKTLLKEGGSVGAYQNTETGVQSLTVCGQKLWRISLIIL